MSVKYLLLLLSLALLFLPAIAGAEDDIARLLPPVSCAAGWKMDRKPVSYDRDTLSDRINGEAELYMPYGFDRMAAARYASEKKNGAGIDVEIYRMGSLLDAFGMYANYRQKDGRSLDLGAESNLSGSQLFFYQDRHFVHIQFTGGEVSSTEALIECARAVASRLPGDSKRPPELAILDRREVAGETMRFLPQSLLGYDFLNKGIMADAVIDGKNLQIFQLLGTTAESAATAFERYRAELPNVKIEPGKNSTVFLGGVDPLYGPVVILKKGSCIAGALKFSGEKGIRVFLERICR